MAHAEQGKIVVYDEKGKVVHEEKFDYKPVKDIRSFVRYTQSQADRDKKKEQAFPPEPPKGMHLVKEEPEEEDNDDERDLDEKRKKNRTYNHQGRSRKIKKIENRKVDGKNVQVITRKERDKRGRVFETKEVTIDNRVAPATRRQQYSASKKAPNAKKIHLERRIK